MSDFTKEELTEALRAIVSVIHKCEKAQEKFPEGNSHHTLLRNRLNALRISKVLITERLSQQEGDALPQAADRSDDCQLLLSNLGKLHTTDLGAQRVKRNLCLDAEDIVPWCRQKIQEPHSKISRRGKNWYVTMGDGEIIVNAHSFTIITAHPLKDSKKLSNV